MKKILMMSVMAMAFAAPAVFAGDPDSHDKSHKGKLLDMMFEQDDTNKDGVISKDEFVASAEGRFAGMDSDKSGTLTKEEARQYHAEKKDKWKDRHDAAKDDATTAPTEKPAE